MKQRLENSIGWYGVLAILLAYCLASFAIISPQTYVYQFLNFTGAVSLIVETLAKKDYQPMFLNVVWGGVALFALVRLAL